jgi:hypothetical protein
VKPEKRLIQALREIDERLTKARSSPELSAREQRGGGRILHYEAVLDLAAGARLLVLVLLKRQGIKFWPKPDSRREEIMISAPAVFLEEVPELSRFEREYVEYLESSAEDFVFRAFGLKLGPGDKIASP